MAPTLVIADAPYKTYPGGVIAVWCKDWIASGSSATSEADALASTGDVVRETQQVNNIVANASTAYQAADDTLELTGLPLTDAINYRVYFSYRIEGYLDLTYGAGLQASHNYLWTNAAIIGLHGDGTNFPETSSYRVSSLLSPRLFYALGTSGNITITDPAESIFVRAFSESGSTIEVLLDQIIFMPQVGYTTALSGYDGEDRQEPTPDGADGGDSNGEFTRYFGSSDNRVAGDYQVEPDDEWMIRETPADFDAYYNFSTGAPLNAHLYTTHGVNYVEEKTWTQDTFDNRSTTPDVSDMGLSPEGYGYDIDGTGVPTNGKAWVAGGVNVNRIYNVGGNVQWTMGEGSPGTNPEHNLGLRTQAVGPDQFEWYINWTWTGGDWATSGTPLVRMHPQTNFATPTFPQLRFDPVGKTWQLVTVPAANDDLHDISSWFGVGAPVGVRMEFKRYWCRVRVWDASGGEPGTWDEEFFLRSSTTDYDYSDDQAKAYGLNDAYRWFLFRVDSGGVVGGTYPITVEVQESTFTHDPYGEDPTDMTAYLESPEGDFVGQIDVPWGSEYMVHWGARNWTEYDSTFGDWYLSLSMKVWNHTGAPEHQRALLGDMRWIEAHFNIVPMNWRSADRSPQGQQRILSGG